MGGKTRPKTSTVIVKLLSLDLLAGVSTFLHPASLHCF